MLEGRLGNLAREIAEETAEELTGRYDRGKYCGGCL